MLISGMVQRRSSPSHVRKRDCRLQAQKWIMWRVTDLIRRATCRAIEQQNDRSCSHAVVTGNGR